MWKRKNRYAVGKINLNKNIFLCVSFFEHNYKKKLIWFGGKSSCLSEIYEVFLLVFILAFLLENITKICTRSLVTGKINIQLALEIKIDR